MIRARAALPLALLALLPGAGCGGDEEQAEVPRDQPQLTVPRTQPEPKPERPAPAQTTETPAEDPATAPLAPGEGDFRSPAPAEPEPDSPANDTPPPAGSPAERFEQECDADPEACG